MKLTNRETEILELIKLYFNNSEIASELSIGKRTVETHVSNILGKYDCRSKKQLIEKIKNETANPAC